MGLYRRLASALALVVYLAAYAEPPTARYASTQIDVAHAELEQARAAAALGDEREAGRLAWSAQLDARIAWAMSDSAPLRSQAAGISQGAARLIHGLALEQVSVAR